MKRSPLLALLLIAFISLMGFGIIIPLLPLYAKHYGAEPWQVGALSASYALMQFIFAPILGRWSDRIGRRPVLLISLAGTVAGFVLMGFAGSLWMLFLARLIDGATGGNIAVAQAYISDITPPEQRTKRIGLLGAALGMGFIVGPALGAFLSSDGSFTRPAFFAAALGLVSLVLTYVVLPEPPREQRTRARGRTSFGAMLAALRHRAVGPLLLLGLLAGLAFVGFETSYALFADQRFGFNTEAVGYSLAYVGVIVAIMQGGLLGKLVELWGETRLLLTGATLLALGFALLAIADGMPLLLTALGVIAVGNGMFDPSLTSLISQRSTPEELGEALGVLQSLHSLTRIGAPLIANGLLQAVAPGAPYVLGALLMTLTALLALRAWRSEQSALAHSAA